MLPSVLVAFGVLLYLVVAVVLVRKYVRTRDVGFVWLGIAVIVWPLVTPLLDAGERVFIDRLTRHQFVSFYPFSMVARGKMTVGSLVASLQMAERLVGVCLLLIAVIYLYKSRDGGELRATR
jgi:hypothetical protein